MAYSSSSRVERSFVVAPQRRTAEPPTLPRQQFADGVVDEFGVFRLEHRVSGAVAPDRRDRPQLGTRHAGYLAPVILDRKIEIGFARHDDRVGGNRPECLVEIAVVKLVGADIGMLPGPQHREQIVGVTATEIRLPATDQKVLERGKADPAPQLLAIKRLAEAP